METKIYIYDLKDHLKKTELFKQLSNYTKSSAKELKSLFSYKPCLLIKAKSDQELAEIKNVLEEFMVQYDYDSGELAEEKKTWLATEVQKWVRRRILPVSYANSILKLYGLEALLLSGGRSTVKHDKKLIKKLVLIFGSLLVGLGMILFVAANWKVIPYILKLSFAIGTSILSLVCAHTFSDEEKKSPYLHMTSILAFFFAGASICLVGQNYNIISDHYSMPLIWGALIFIASISLRYCPGYIIASCLMFLANALSVYVFETQLWFYPIILIASLIFSYKNHERKIHFSLNYVFSLIFMVMAIATDQILLWSLLLVPVLLISFKNENELDEIGANIALLSSLLAAFAIEGVAVNFAVLAVIFVVMLIKQNSQADVFALVGLSVANVAYMQEYSFPNIYYIPLLAIFAWKAFNAKNNGLAILTVLSFIYWIFCFYSQLIDYNNFADPKLLDISFFVLAIGALLAQLGICIKKREDYTGLSTFMQILGFALLAVFSYAFSFHAYKSDTLFHTSMLFSSSSFLMISASLFCLYDNYQKNKLDIYGSITKFMILVSFYLSWVTVPLSFTVPVAFNLSLFGGALLLVLKGNNSKKYELTNWGIGIFIFLLISRYFDTFSALLSRSIFFISIGLLMIVWVIVSDLMKKKFKKSGL